MGNPSKNSNSNHDATNFRNVLILSVGFMLLMAAWITTAGIEQTILQSVQVDDPTFTGDGYLSQAIVNGAFALTNFLAPTIVTLAGVRTTLVFGASLYTLFVSSFLYPNAWLLYATSAAVGFGSANVWVANGIYFTRSSTKETIGLYMGVYWAIMSLGQLSGNTFVFWKFQGMNHIDQETRYMVISILTVVAILSSVTFIFLGVPPEYTKSEKKSINLYASITQPFRLLSNKHTLLLIPSAMYNGMVTAYRTSIYPTSVAFSEAFGGDTRKLVGFTGIIIGIGNLMGGLVFGVLVEKCSFIKSKRNFIVTSACFAHCLASLLMYFNLADASPLIPTLDTSWINPPSIPIAMLCAFLLGLGDGCISPQMCAVIGVIWPEDPSSALAIYRFFQAATCAMGYYIGTLTGLYNQLLIFGTMTLVGTLTFRINEGLIAKGDNNVYSLDSAGVVEPVSVKVHRKFSDGLNNKSKS